MRIDRAALFACRGSIRLGLLRRLMLRKRQREHHVGLKLFALVIALGTDHGRLELDLEQLLDKRGRTLLLILGLTMRRLAGQFDCKLLAKSIQQPDAQLM